MCVFGFPLVLSPAIEWGFFFGKNVILCRSARHRAAPLCTRKAGLRSWRVSIIRKRGQYPGTVEAPNEKAAEAAAVAEFDLSDEQCRRLFVQERS